MRNMNTIVKRPPRRRAESVQADAAQDVLDREMAREAGEEVAEATSPFVGAGVGVEAAAQAEVVAHREVRTEEHEGELTAEDRREVSRSVFRLAWPAIAENALQTLMGIVDTIVVARLGTAALSGVGLAQQLVWILTTALVAISMGTTVLIARYTGSKERGEANSVLKQSLMLSALMSLVLMPIGFLSQPLMTVLGLEPVAASEGATYLQITLFAALPLVMMLIAGAALRGSGDTRTPMFVTASINVVNAILAVELVFGGPKASEILSGWLSGLLHLVGLGQVNLPTLSFIPEMGVAGSAWASVTARTIGIFILLAVLIRPWRFLSVVGRSGGKWRLDMGIVKRMLGIGIPTAFEQLFMSLGVLLYNFLVIGMGEVVFATSRVALNIVFISQMP
jgi:putative MATE family efflux protein